MLLSSPLFRLAAPKHPLFFNPPISEWKILFRHHKVIWWMGMGQNFISKSDFKHMLLLLSIRFLYTGHLFRNTVIHQYSRSSTESTETVFSFKNYLKQFGKKKVSCSVKKRYFAEAEHGSKGCFLGRHLCNITNSDPLVEYSNFRVVEPSIWVLVFFVYEQYFFNLKAPLVFNIEFKTILNNKRSRTVTKKRNLRLKFSIFFAVNV